jgi:hypothetical protein
MFDKTLSFKGEQCSSGKKSKESVAVTVECNAGWSGKLPFIVMRKRLNTCYFDVKQRTANGKARVTSSIFSDCLLALKNASSGKRDIALIVDTCPARSLDVNLRAIKLILCHRLRHVSCRLATRTT